MDQKECKLSAVMRDKVGKGSARLLRKNGQIPAIIYGNMSDPKPIALSAKDISKRLYSKNFMTTILTLDIGKELVHVIPKDYQLDPVSDILIHADFLQVSEGSTVTVHVPVRFINENKSPGIKQGGKLNVVCHEVSLLCPANNIPDSITVDLNDLKIGDSIHMEDIRLPEKTSSMSQLNITIATIVAPISGS
ncbi:50S ribosomal protein L25/general stress protein Ctc [Candidatus Liberibacter asiaticus]|uniref:Large ribosomal subunit protein bL25 n=2 Tax=Liberibacter asiaticus TaxID=34021 RepID=C6XHZ8_LIBAP|nr:50S ribosomal protein L25/general stress protein Ctc [Candidatus Liberibacter asiaticus]ACT56891.1 50S ribosomal protein L25/general stress protein Ctc [Candidatus Liberibacter asiaticus str. psy62]AGH16655.1 50S ribosomal protein L25/general stress protein Ctc [Candidatus Liberibacter asiaticus str. gxpsy]ALK07041.1 50S ribosomal protein L25/general stress protein Ctc [Candidatus Liberibacter asiaticus]ASK52511.1 50S ribosomal protein L25/general stress protein Ctc [Candidatus Liberibacter 